jgi:hypothetical protein
MNNRMFPLTMDGLERAMRTLSKNPTRTAAERGQSIDRGAVTLGPTPRLRFAVSCR